MSDDLSPIKKTTISRDIDSKIFDLSEDQKQEIVKKQIKNAGIGIIGDTLGLGSLVRLLSINDEVKKEIRQEIIEKVINECLIISEQNQNTLDQLLKLLNSKTGNILFNKFLVILDDVDPDKDQFINYFSRVLKQILVNDFEMVFEKHNFVLSIIGSISMQAIAILADNREWKVFSLEPLRGQYSFEDRVLTTDRWRSLFADEYLSKKSIKGITYGEVKERVIYSLSELQRYELIVPTVLSKHPTMSMGNVKDAKIDAQLRLTNLGMEIVSYFSID